MKLIVIISSLMVVCSARPEPPSFGGYPSGGPSGNGFSSGNGHGNGHGAADFGGASNGFGAPSASGGNGQVVHKHVYVHVPPAEPQVVKPKKVYPQPVPQKHYKIVFIKAPTPPTPTVPDLPPPVQDEQKTLIYVLVKKPEEQPDIVIPTPVPTKPSKPEVYFIRYKTQKSESGGNGNGGGNGGGNGYPEAGAPAGPSFSSSAPSGPSSSYGVPGAGSY